MSISATQDSAPTDSNDRVCHRHKTHVKQRLFIDSCGRGDRYIITTLGAAIGFATIQPATSFVY